MKSTGSSSWRCSCRCAVVFAGNVVLLLVLGLVSSVIDNVFGVLSFFLFPWILRVPLHREYLGILCVALHAKCAGSLMSFHHWNVHDIVQEPDMCEASAL